MNKTCSDCYEEVDPPFVVKLCSRHAATEQMYGALKGIASQKSTTERIDEMGEEAAEGDYEGAYDIMIGIARTAIANYEAQKND